MLCATQVAPRLPWWCWLPARATRATTNKHTHHAPPLSPCSRAPRFCGEPGRPRSPRFRGECNRGLKCDHCHLVHPGQKRKRIRPSKATRLWRRRHEQVAGVDDLFDEVDLAELTPPHDESGTSLNQSRDEVDATWVGPEQPGRAAPSVAQVGAWPSYMFEDAGDPGPAVCFETVEWSELGPRTSLPAVAGNAAGSAEAMDRHVAGPPASGPPPPNYLAAPIAYATLH